MSFVFLFLNFTYCYIYFLYSIFDCSRCEYVSFAIFLLGMNISWKISIDTIHL